ncbi:unnamed protein product [Clonostachys chloroleuca]|uniref:Zn(2)-C6 fungal-type domain-containing protein n=1 Tax=Clonostachys chloroleuca TaxID=1926264 RepID=A0AA35LT13_9HYPO|nr:unnamed protein product [Clonostachys chloroleuca]
MDRKSTRQSRQVSCHFCRERKLKCSRSFPCSNCTSRGVECPAVAPATAIRPTSHTIPIGSHAEILNRLARLESLLAAQHEKMPLSPPGSASNLVGGGSDVPAPQPLKWPLSTKLQALVEDAVSIHSRCPGLDFHNLSPNNTFIVRICPLRLFRELLPDDANSLPTSQLKKIWLPDRKEANVLIKKYLNGLTVFLHVTHGPSIQKLAAEVYDALEAGGSHVPTGYLLLLLAIFGNVILLWTACSEEEEALFPHAGEASAQAASWIKVALEVLYSTQAHSAPSLEYAQGLTILSFTILNMDGVTPRGLSLLFQATAVARELGLHRLDHQRQGFPSMQFPAITGIRAEVGRRVWWYLASADWLLSSSSNAQRGTYSINPLHMAVQKPMNIHDEDMAEDGMTAKPIEVFTAMSYSIYRIRLAEEIRMLTDKHPLIAFDPYAVAYSHVMEADAAFDRLLSSLPPFFREQPGDVNAVDPVIDRETQGTMMWHKHLLNLSINGQRIKLHLPYLARGAAEPEYAQSHRISIETAWKVINSEYKLRRENSTFTSPRFKLGVVMYGFFLSVAVLVLDMCLATDEAEREAKKQQTQPAWMILLEAQSESSIVGPAVELLTFIMQKHNVGFDTMAILPPQAITVPGQVPTGQNTPHATWEGHTFQSTEQHHINENAMERDADAVDTYFNMLWMLEKPFI